MTNTSSLSIYHPITGSTLATWQFGGVASSAVRARTTARRPAGRGIVNQPLAGAQTTKRRRVRRRRTQQPQALQG